MVRSSCHHDGTPRLEIVGGPNGHAHIRAPPPTGPPQHHMLCLFPPTPPLGKRPRREHEQLVATVAYSNVIANQFSGRLARQYNTRVVRTPRCGVRQMQALQSKGIKLWTSGVRDLLVGVVDAFASTQARLSFTCICIFPYYKRIRKRILAALDSLRQKHRVTVKVEDVAAATEMPHSGCASSTAMPHKGATALSTPPRVPELACASPAVLGATRQW